MWFDPGSLPLLSDGILVQVDLHHVLPTGAVAICEGFNLEYNSLSILTCCIIPRTVATSFTS